MPPTDRFVAELELLVRYAETDGQGVVYHANYLIYMDEARTNYTRVRNAGHAQFEKEGYLLAVTDVTIHYVSAARYGDRVTIRTWITEFRS